MDEVKENPGAVNMPTGGMPPVSPYPYNYGVSAYPPVKHKPSFSLQKKDYIFAAAFAVCCIGVVFMGLWGGFNLGFTVSYAALFAALSFYLVSSKQFPGVYACVCGLLTLGTLPVFFLCDDSTIKFLSLISICGLSAVWFYSLAGRTEEHGDLGLVRNLLVYTVGNTGKSFQPAFRGLFSGESTRKKEAGKIIIGIICAAPVAAVVIILLSNADDAFEGLIGSVVENIGAGVFKTMLGLFAAAFVTAFAFGLKKTEKETGSGGFGGSLATTYSAAFTGVLSVCYVVYLFSQLAYFFTAFRGILPDGYSFSYAEYARRGFFELCGIAAINFMVVFAVLLVTEKKDGHLRGVLKGLCTFICVFTLVIISTAIAKMVMYINEYGMTRLRIETSAFMVFLAVVFISLIIRLFVSRVKVLRTALVTAACVLIVLGIGNMDSFIAGYNYEHIYAKGNDYDAVSELLEVGTECIPYLVKLTESKHKETVSLAEEELYWTYKYYGYYKCEWEPCDPYSNGEEWMYQKWDLDTSIRPKEGFIHINKAVREAYAALDEYIAAHPEMIKAVENYSYYSEEAMSGK